MFSYMYACNSKGPIIIAEYNRPTIYQQQQQQQNVPGTYRIMVPC